MRAAQPLAQPRTRLSQDLRQRPARRVTPVQLFQLARRQWLAGERVEVGALAAQLGIGRATAFRWVGSRELLLGEVVWSLYAPLMERAALAVRSRGARRVAGICESSIRTMLEFAPLRRFIQQDPEYGLRLLTSKAGPVQARAIEKVRELLTFEAARGALKLPLNVDTLAYLIVRIGESFVYADVISGQRVDVGDAALAIELLLSGKVARRPRKAGGAVVR